MFRMTNIHRQLRIQVTMDVGHPNLKLCVSSSKFNISCPLLVRKMSLIARGSIKVEVMNGLF